DCPESSAARTGRGTSPMRRPRPNGARAPHASARPVSVNRRRPQRASIATDDWRSQKETRASLEFLSLMLPQDLLGFAYVFPRERTGLDQMGDQGPALAAKQTQKIVDQLALRGFPRNRSFENMRVADLLCPPQCLFRLQTVDHRLDGAVGGLFPRRERIV